MEKGKILRKLNTPFPRPKWSRKNLFLLVLIGLSASLFILIYKPFGIENQTGEFFVDLIIFSLGIVFILSILFMEWLIPKAFPSLFKRWTLGKAFAWYTLLILFVGTVNFLFKNYWGGFIEFTWLEFLFVLGRTLIIGITVSFFVLGIWQYFNSNKISKLSENEIYNLTTQDGKKIGLNLSSILYISSDDNYLDIHILSDKSRIKKVVRSSLKNVESQIVNPFSPIKRCHRSYLINPTYFKIEKSSSRQMIISLIGFDDKLPVSKNYIRDIKNLL